jgi:hypothetical protein
MFHFPALPRPALCVQAGVTASYGRWVSPFGNPRITVWLPTPRGLSQAPTSFIGSWCQGIHRAPLKTWQHFFADALQGSTKVLPIFRKKMLASTVQFSRYGRHKAPPPHLRWKGLALAEVPGLCFPHYCVYTGRFPQDPTACSSSRLAWQLVPCRPAVLARTQRRDVLAAALRGSRMNNQCSTRKAVDAEADDRCLTAPGAP